MHGLPDDAPSDSFSTFKPWCFVAHHERDIESYHTFQNGDLSTPFPSKHHINRIG